MDTLPLQQGFIYVCQTIVSLDQASKIIQYKSILTEKCGSIKGQRANKIDQPPKGDFQPFLGLFWAKETFQGIEVSRRQ